MMEVEDHHKNFFSIWKKNIPAFHLRLMLSAIKTIFREIQQLIYILANTTLVVGFSRTTYVLSFYDKGS